MIGRVALVIALMSTAALAQDVPGIEICTVDKTMERRTSCLQSNVEFLVKTINRLRGENELKLAAANREIAALKASVTEMQRTFAEMKAVKPKESEPAKGTPATAK